MYKWIFYVSGKGKEESRRHRFGFRVYIRSLFPAVSRLHDVVLLQVLMFRLFINKSRGLSWIENRKIPQEWIFITTRPFAKVVQNTTKKNRCVERSLVPNSRSFVELLIASWRNFFENLQTQPFLASCSSFDRI